MQATHPEGLPATPDFLRKGLTCQEHSLQAWGSVGAAAIQPAPEHLQAAHVGYAGLCGLHGLPGSLAVGAAGIQGGL